MSAMGKRKYTPLFFLALAGWVMLGWAFYELGMWQLRRAAEKQGLLDLYQDRVSREPADWEWLRGLEKDEGRYRRIRIRGHYDVSKQFLLDNQVADGQVGYHVLTPFLVDGGGSCILVNRGWIPLGDSRARLPVLSEPSGHRVLTGTLDRFPSIALKLKGADDPGVGSPAVVQLLDSARIAARLGKEVLPMQLLLDDGPEDGYRRAWRAPNVTPEKNKGYAFQWFSLAALVAGYGAFWVINGGFRRNPRVDMK